MVFDIFHLPLIDCVLIKPQNFLYIVFLIITDNITAVIFEFGCRGCTYIGFFTHSIHPFCKHTFLLPNLSLYQVRISKRNRSTNFPTSFGSQKQAMQLFHTLTQTHLEADDKHSYEHSYGFYRKSFSTNLFRSLLVPVEFICPRVVVLS